jgi:hypothetical protein
VGFLTHTGRQSIKNPTYDAGSAMRNTTMQNMHLSNWYMKVRDWKAMWAKFWQSTISSKLLKKKNLGSFSRIQPKIMKSRQSHKKEGWNEKKKQKKKLEISCWATISKEANLGVMLDGGSRVGHPVPAEYWKRRDF